MVMCVRWAKLSAYDVMLCYENTNPSVLVPRAFLYGRGERGEGRKGLVNNSTPTRIHGCIPAVSVDEEKRECQVGVSRE